jgi:very-short-patch-repair endonuclease
MTPAEAMLWERLRKDRLDGYRFRRQHPIGPFITDFCCPAVRLVVEVDGPIHRLQQEQDAARRAYLEERGYQVVRFSNDEVVFSIDTVLQRIRNILT